MSKSTAVCRYFASGGTCFYGNECQFIHATPDRLPPKQQLQHGPPQHPQHAQHHQSPHQTGNQQPNQSGNNDSLLPEEVLFTGYDLPAESKLSSYITPTQASQVASRGYSPENVQIAQFYAGGQLPPFMAIPQRAVASAPPSPFGSSQGPLQAQSPHRDQASISYQVSTVPQASYQSGAVNRYQQPCVPECTASAVQCLPGEFYQASSSHAQLGVPFIVTKAGLQRLAPLQLEYDRTLQCVQTQRSPLRSTVTNEMVHPSMGYRIDATPIVSSNVGFLRPLQATRMPKEAPLATSLSNLSMQDINAQEFVPVSSRGSSSSLNNVSSQPMAHSLSAPIGAFAKGGPAGHLLRDRDSPDNSPVIARRSYIRNPSPLTVNGGEYAAAAAASMYQESLGGTTYFYQPTGGGGDENGGEPGNALVVAPEAAVAEMTGAASGGMAAASGLPIAPAPEVITPAFHMFPGPPAHVEHMKPKANAPSFFMSDELRLELLNRAALLNSRVNVEMFPDLPQHIDNYTNICPLETQVNKSHCYGYVTSVYRATNVKTGLIYCLRRIHGFRLSSTKTIIEIIDHWKKIQHSNLVQLRELFTTKAFGDNSVVFVYDFFAGAQTMKQVYFNGPGSSGGGSGPAGGVISSGYNGTPATHNGMGPPQSKNRVGSRGLQQHQDGSLRQGHGLLPESLIWTYVVQLSSALRTIHAANLAIRCLDPSKVLLSSAGKSRLRLNCAAIVDVITLDSAQPGGGAGNQRTAAMVHCYQKEDLAHLGRLILCLACNSSSAYQFVESSMELVTKNYSSDLRNLLVLLLSMPPRVSSINDVMPMIGARFYTQLDAAQMRGDVLEAELAKEVDSSRLFRLLVKLGAINERPELNIDTTWSETGDRYMLKLFRDFLFHQCTKEGQPWLDMAHVVQCLNKLDAGVEDKICLVSRDEQNVLVVSYAELKRCIESAFREIYDKM